jgi:glutamate 5-kinase
MSSPMTSRSELAAARRVVVKVGSSSLATSGEGLSAQAVRRISTAVARRLAQGSQVVLVSSGAIAAGIAPLGLARRPRDLATLQAVASVGQGQLVHAWTEAFAEHGRVVGQVLLTADDVTRRAHYRNARTTLERLLELGVVPVVNENDAVATDEIRMGDNDRLAALVAHLVGADLLVLLTDVEGLYDAPPGTPGAVLVPEVTSPLEFTDFTLRGSASDVGSGGMASKLEAARIAAGAGVEVLLAAAADVERVLGHCDTGTHVHAFGPRITSRLLWLAHATTPRGRLVLDAGAVTAIVQRRVSLLPVGVTSCEGDFLAGDPVELVSPEGVTVARGLVGFDADELPALLGRSTRDLAAELGPAYERELVHRDDLVVL